jgi:hypothetical protein
MPLLKIHNLTSERLRIESLDRTFKEHEYFEKVYSSYILDKALSELRKYQKINLIRFTWSLDDSDILGNVDSTTYERLKSKGVPRIQYDKDLDKLFYWNDALQDYIDFTSIDTGISWNKETFTLDATDISNGYVDLAQTPISNSLDLGLNGVLQTEGASDQYTITTNRVTLVTPTDWSIGNIIEVKYQYNV